MSCGIYKITNNIDGKVYIGQSINIEKRWLAHKYAHHTGHVYLYKAMRCYGIDSFTFTIIEEAPPHKLDALECKYIELYKSMNSIYGYNNKTGGGTGVAVSDEVRKKMSDSMKQRYKRIGVEGMKKGPMSNEQKDKIRQAHLGRKFSDEVKQKISSGLRGRKLSNSHIEKLRERMNDKERNPRILHQRNVVCVNDGMVFENAYHAANFYGISVNGVYQCCNKKRELYKDLQFQYKV